MRVRHYLRIIRLLVHNSAFLTCKNDVGAQAAVSSTPRSPGKIGPAGRTTKRLKHRRGGDAARGHSGRAETGGPVSVLRRPGERGAKDSSHGEPPTLAAWSADKANENELPSRAPNSTSWNRSFRKRATRTSSCARKSP